MGIGIGTKVEMGAPRVYGCPIAAYTVDAARALSILGIPSSDDAEKMIEYIESKLDELNTNSQEQMILLQSQTNKRDQSYELISNALKSVFTVMNGVVNNY